MQVYARYEQSHLEGVLRFDKVLQTSRRPVDGDVWVIGPNKYVVKTVVDNCSRKQVEITLDGKLSGFLRSRIDMAEDFRAAGWRDHCFWSF